MAENHVFSALSKDENKLLIETPALVTILVAGADGDIDEQELNWAEKLTHIRSYAKPEELNHYYEAVEAHFDSALEFYMDSLSKDQSERETQITDELRKLNHALSCLDNPTAFKLYESFVSFAKHIAKASGGFLRFGSISRDEKKWIGLPMINPIILEVEENEETE